MVILIQKKCRSAITTCGKQMTLLSMKYAYTETARLQWADGTETSKEVEAVYIKHLTYPFAIELIMDRMKEGDLTQLDFTIVSHDVASPRSARETGIFQILQTNEPNANGDEYIKYQQAVNSEDTPIVESQRPEELPLNIAAELHIPADKFSIRYRRQLVDLFGLGSPELTA